jgi:hypothetical protein
MPGWESNNEKVVNKPKNREEEQKERIQRKIDKLQKKEEKFNHKLTELNKNATETQKGIIASTWNSMEIVVWWEINKNPLETDRAILTVDSKVWLQKSFSSPDNHNTITVWWTLWVWKQFIKTETPPPLIETPPSPWDWHDGLPENDWSWTTWVGNTSYDVVVNWDNTTDETDVVSTDVNNTPTPTNTIEDNKTIDTNPKTYINPELYIKTKNDKGLTFWATVGGALGGDKKIVYASGNVGYETKWWLWLEATGWAKINVNTANIIPYWGLNLYKTLGDFKINLWATTSTKNQLRVWWGITYNF